MRRLSARKCRQAGDCAAVAIGLLEVPYLRFDLLQPTLTQAYRHILTVVLHQIVNYLYCSNTLCLIQTYRRLNPGSDGRRRNSGVQRDGH